MGDKVGVASRMTRLEQRNGINKAGVTRRGRSRERRGSGVVGEIKNI
jgi:hypothetical protein